MLDKQALKYVPEIYIDSYMLRAIKRKDIKDMFEYCSDEEVVRYLTFKPHKTIKDSKWVYKHIFKKNPKKGIPLPYVIVDTDLNKMIGMCDFTAYNPIENSASIGYTLNKKYWGKGIMPKACIAVMEHGFFYLGLDKITISHDINNHASRKVIEKCGFNFVEEERQYFSLVDRQVVVRKYEITREEYMKGRF